MGATGKLSQSLNQIHFKCSQFISPWRRPSIILPLYRWTGVAYLETKSILKLFDIFSFIVLFQALSDENTEKQQPLK